MQRAWIKHNLYGCPMDCPIKGHFGAKSAKKVQAMYLSKYTT